LNVLITGATGFIGGGIARAAIAQGWQVTATHRGTSPANAPGIEWRALDATENWPPSRRFDAVIHAAALRHRHGIEPSAYGRTNAELTRRVIHLARRHASRLVLISSIAVYGWPKKLPIDESFPKAPVGEYGRSKIECEHEVREAGIPYTIVEPSITYGPGDTNGMMDKILHMVARRRFVLPGLGRTRVQLIYIDDLARLVLGAATSTRTRNETFICTYREPISIRELVRLAADAVGTHLPLVGPPVALLKLAALAFELGEWAGLIAGEPPLTREKLATVSVDRAYKIDRMRGLLGDEPRVGYGEGFRRTAQALGFGS
jgi:nucleoside-diphosphate-sugar epimerase